MGTDKTEKDLLQDISGKLDRLMALMAAHGKDVDTPIHILRGFGYDWPFIGSIVGLSPDAARMRMKYSHAKKA